MKFLKFLGIATCTYITLFFFVAVFCFIFWDWNVIQNVFTFTTEKGAAFHRGFILLSVLIGCAGVGEL